MTFFINKQNTTTMVHFMSIAELKQLLGAENQKIEILQDKITGNKSFCIDGIYYRVSKTWDASKPSIFHTDKEIDSTPDWTQGILSNVDESKLKKEVIGAI